MNSFMLTGMKYAISKKMKVCGAIHEKCCTIDDEIKISKMWNNRMLPVLDSYSDQYMTFMMKIVKAYWEMMKIDPRMIVLKYVDFRHVFYDDMFCYSKIRRETRKAKNEFLTYQDYKLAYAMTGNHKASVKKYTHEKKVRHYNIKTSNYYKRLKKSIKRKPYVMRPRIEYKKTTCKKNPEGYFKEFVMINEKKAEFCFDLYEKFLNFNNKQFINYLPTIKNSISSI